MEPQGSKGQATGHASRKAQDVSVLSRMATLLNAFSIARPALTVEEAAGLIGASEATAYRYLGELCQAGLLARRTGAYVLGPKIIELEYITQTCDPIMRAGEKLMRDLADTVGCNVLLCNIYNETIVNVFHAVGREPLSLTFTKGRPMPLFRGSQARAILAFLERRRLRRIFDRHRDDPELQRIAADWTAFKALMRETRRRGYYISRGELDADVAGIAAPVFDPDGTVLGSLVLAYPSPHPPPISDEVLARIVVEAAQLVTRTATRGPES